MKQTARVDTRLFSWLYCVKGLAVLVPYLTADAA